MKKDRSVVKALLMISQIGISMIVPIFLGAFAGYWLEQWLGTGFLFLIFLLFGILAAFRNIYKLTKPFYAEDLKREEAEQAYWAGLKKERAQKLGAAAQDAAEQSGMGKSKEAQSGSAKKESCGKPAPDGAKARRERMQLLMERGMADARTAPKSLREEAEEEFAAWRREREKGHDRGISHDDGDDAEDE